MSSGGMVRNRPDIALRLVVSAALVVDATLSAVAEGLGALLAVFGIIVGRRRERPPRNV